MKITELLSPAGNLEKLKIAIDYGADAVYSGLNRFSLRLRANKEFNIDTFKEGIDYVHNKGKKLYVTINGFPFNTQIEGLKKHIIEISKLKPDAFIVASLGAIKLCRELSPQIPIHVSTQANVVNYMDAKVYYDMGVKRIVSAREVSLDDLIKIKEELPKLELEVFVHGSMCFAFSGRCLISALQSGRIPNRGSCANDCRFPYAIYAKNEENGALFKLEEEQGVGTYIFNSKDLNLASKTHKILKSGVISAFKIEGRTKSPYYTAISTSTYRKAIDDFYNGISGNEEDYQKELHSIQNRGYTEAFLLRRPFEGKKVQNHDFSMRYGTHQVSAFISQDNEYFLCKHKMVLNKEYEIISPNKIIDEINNDIGEIYFKNKKYYVKFKKFISKNKRELEEVHSGNINPIKLPNELPINSFLRFEICQEKQNTAVKT